MTDPTVSGRPDGEPAAPATPAPAPTPDGGRPSAAEAGGARPSSGGGRGSRSGGTKGDGPPAKRAAPPARGRRADPDRNPEELPERIFVGKPKDPVAAERALVKRPQIGDTRPAPPSPPTEPAAGESVEREGSGDRPRKRRRGGRGRGGGQGDSSGGGERPDVTETGAKGGGPGGGSRGGGSGGGAGASAKGSRAKPSGAKPSGGKASGGRASAGRAEPSSGGADRRGASRASRGDAGDEKPSPVEALTGDAPPELDEKTLKGRRGRERKGRPVGRYMMCVNVQPRATQIAVLEGRNLIEHYVSHPSDDVFQIHGNIYLGRVQNVLPGMEAAFIDIGTPKNAVLYRGDVQYDAEDIEEKGDVRIEDVLKARQAIICQVTKNPIGHKGARLTQEVSLPGRFVVLIPNSSTYGISKRLADDERKRLRKILDRVRPAGHGIIVRTAAENITAPEIERDVARLLEQWAKIEALASEVKAPALLYREPDMAVRVIREEFNADYRSIVIDDPALFDEVRSYVGVISPALAERVEHYDPEAESLSLFERFHVTEQLHKALDRKVWLPSGGSLIIEHTEALTVIDVNTGKNVGTSSLEETVYLNNLEAAEEIARQLRLRDIGGIIVIDFIDMEKRENRDEVIRVFRSALARDKTRTQVFDISELGLVEMTRKRIGEGLLESFSTLCDSCEGRGVVVDESLIT